MYVNILGDVANSFIVDIQVLGLHHVWYKLIISVEDELYTSDRSSIIPKNRQYKDIIVTAQDNITLQYTESWSNSSFYTLKMDYE